MDAARASLRQHWQEYLIEAAGLGVFMVVAGICVMLLEQPGSPLHQAIASPELRRALIGVAMGLTAIALIYSPCRRSRPSRRCRAARASSSRSPPKSRSPLS